MTSRAESDLRDQIEAADTQVGRFYISAHCLDGPGAFAVREREAVPIASMYKVLLALEVAERISTGVLDPHELIAVDPVNHTPAGVGLNQFRWPAYVARADLIHLALAWSDNTASDLLHGDVGTQALMLRAARLGLGSVSVIGDCRTLLGNAGEDLGYSSAQQAEAADWAPPSDASDLDRTRTSVASAHDLTTLAEALATDSAASPAASSLVRRSMKEQVWTSRFGRAFPSPPWHRCSKTGTLPPWRGEFGIVWANRMRVAVCVILRQASATTTEEQLDSAVASVAAQVVAHVTSQPSALGREGVR